MSWPSSFGVAVLTAVVGLIATGILASLTASWYRIPNFEAQSAAYVVSLAIFGMIGGFIIGLVSSRLIPAADPGFWRALGISNGVLLGLLIVIGGVARVLADIPPTIDGETLMLAVELRWPESQKTSPASIPGEPTLMLGSITRMSHTQRASSTGPLWTSDAKVVDGRWVAPGAVDIFTTRGHLSIVAMLDSTTNHGFLIPLSGSPSRKDFEWTEWYPHARPGAPPLADGFTYRYRVQKWTQPIRTETIGSFEVGTIASHYHNESMDSGKTVLASNGRFLVSHRGKRVSVDAKKVDTKVDEDSLDRADGVAVIAGANPGLLVHFADAAGQGPCYVLTDDADRLSTVYVPSCTFAGGSILTSDTAAFREGERKTPRGRINRVTFVTPALYTTGRAVLDTRRLTVHEFGFPESFSIFPSTAPLGISPDERSFVRVGSDYNANPSTCLAVSDFVGNRSYLVPIDESRMRFANADALDPAWLMHHFEWKKAGDGVDSLVERKGFVPIPYHSRLSEPTSYWFEPAKAALRDAILDLLVAEFKGERVPVESYAYDYPVKIDGQVINVAYGDSGHYVAVSVPRGVTDTKLLETVVKRIDAVLATGKYDAMFGK